MINGYKYLIVFLVSGSVSAQEQPPNLTNPEPKANVYPSEKPAERPPYSLNRRLPQRILDHKREGSYLTGVPAIALSPDTGLLYGIVLFHYENGPKSDPRFASTPYLRKISLLAVQSTKGFQQLKIDFDWPSYSHSAHRLRPGVHLTNNISEQYFGKNDLTLQTLNYPNEIRTTTGETRANDFTRYEQELSKKRTDGTTYFRYHHYIHEEQKIFISDEIKVLSSDTSVKIGIASTNIKVTDYSFRKVDALSGEKEVKATSAKTKLWEDHERATVTGIDGARINQIELGAGYDTRDFEPDPSSGITGGIIALISRHELGSKFDYAKYLLNSKGFYSPRPELTLGLQMQYVMTEGDVPFWDLAGLGGRNSLKGHRVSRFKSRSSSQINSEARWRVHTINTGSQNFVLTPIFFADYGRVYDELLSLSRYHWRRGLGTGLRIVWNQATVIGIEKTLQGEEKSLYVNINHIF